MNKYKLALSLFVSLFIVICLISLKFTSSSTFQDGKNISQHKKYIRLTVDEAQKAAQQNNLPFAAVLVSKNGNVLHSARNTINSDGCLINHAEINILKMIDLSKPEVYEGSILYVSTEPCPMCTAAVDRMSKYVSKIVFGASASTLAKYSKKTRNVIESHRLLSLMGSNINIEGPILEEEAENIHINYWEK